MGASCLTLHVAPLDIPLASGCSNPLSKWEMCLHHSYPAYSAWDEFVANQAHLRANSLKYREEQPGVARKGHALTFRDRTLWALRSLIPLALFGKAGPMA